jgi:hypothetical protein
MHPLPCTATFVAHLVRPFAIATLSEPTRSQGALAGVVRDGVSRDQRKLRQRRAWPSGLPFSGKWNALSWESRSGHPERVTCEKAKAGQRYAVN